MDLLTELRAHLRAFVLGRETRGRLQDWLSEFAEDIADSPDMRVQQLAGHAWLALSERDAGDRTEEGVQVEIARALLTEGVEEPVTV